MNTIHRLIPARRICLLSAALLAACGQVTVETGSRGNDTASSSGGAGGDTISSSGGAGGNTMSSTGDGGWNTTNSTTGTGGEGGAGAAGGAGGAGGSGGSVSPCGPNVPCSSSDCWLPATPADYPAWHGPEGLRLADMNADGFLDVVVANDEGANSGSVSVYLGSCGVLSPDAYFTGGGVNSRDVAVGDVDGDGKLDAVTADGTGSPDIPCTMSVYLGSGDGSLQPPMIFETGGLQTGSIALGDLDGDGHLDAATTNEITGDVSVLLGAGDGTFGPYQLVPSGAPDDFGTGIVARDIDVDGHVDLALTNRFDNSVSLLFGHGDGTFEPFVKLDVQEPSGPIGLDIADVNGDGHLDIAATDQSYGQVRFFAGLGDRMFAPPVTSSAGMGQDMYLKGIVLADFTLDGELDAAVLNGIDAADVRLLAGHGDGTFEHVATYPVGLFPQQNTIVTGDMNLDGRPDIVVTARNSFLVQVFLSGN